MVNETKTTTLTKTNYKTQVIQAMDTYLPMITQQVEGYKMTITDVDKKNILSGISQINELISKEGMLFNDLEQNNLTNVLRKIVTLKLNPSAIPCECYFKLENEKQADGTYKKKLKYEIQGAGYDTMLRRLGVDVEKVLYVLVIHEGDEFILPYFDGEKMCPPTWRPKSMYGKVTKVCYVIEKKGGIRDYLIAEREGLDANLKAHIINNLRQVPEELKNPILKKIEKMSFEEILNDEELISKVNYKAKKWNKENKVWEEYNASVQIISPAWYQSSSREAMIERKLRNNAVKKYPKDFGNDMVKQDYESTYDDYDQYREEKRINPIDVVDVEYSENKATSKANPILMPNSSTNEEIAHYEPKNDQIQDNTPSQESEMPY